MSESLERINKIIKSETNVEVLQGMLSLTAAENNRLREVIKQIEKENAAREQQILNFEENIKTLRRITFEKSSDVA